MVAQQANMPFSYVWDEMDCLEMFKTAKAIQEQVEQLQQSAKR